MWKKNPWRRIKSENNLKYHEKINLKKRMNNEKKEWKLQLKIRSKMQ